jgi:hypothetical protein
LRAISDASVAFNRPRAVPLCMKLESVGQLFDIVTRLLRQYAFSYWTSNQSVIQLAEE